MSSWWLSSWEGLSKPERRLPTTTVLDGGTEEVHDLGHRATGWEYQFQTPFEILKYCLFTDLGKNYQVNTGENNNISMVPKWICLSKKRFE